MSKYDRLQFTDRITRRKIYRKATNTVVKLLNELKKFGDMFSKIKRRENVFNKPNAEQQNSLISAKKPNISPKIKGDKRDETQLNEAATIKKPCSI